MLLAILLLVTSNLLLAFPRVLASLPLLASPNVPAVCSCASADFAVADVLSAIDNSTVPAVSRVSAVAAGPSAVDVPFGVSNVSCIPAVDFSPAVIGVPVVVANFPDVARRSCC